MVETLPPFAWRWQCVWTCGACSCVGGRTTIRGRAIFHLIFSLPCLFVIVRFIVPMPWSIAAKIVVAFVLLLASQYHLWSRLSSGSVFAPEFPRAIVLAFNWAFGAILLLALLQLALDVARILALAIGRGGFAVPDGLRYAIGVTALLLAAIGVAQAVRVPPVRDVAIDIPGLSPDFDGYTILQLTDLHISRLFSERWTRVTVDRANALGTDLIVITGDLIDGSVAMRRADIAPLGRLRAADGVWVIPGNHEYFFGYDAWMRHFAELGMRVLANDHAVLA